MSVRLFFIIPWAILTLALSTNASGTEEFEYNLPSLIGDYIGRPWDPLPYGRNAYIVYEGPPAELMRIEVRLTGNGTGAKCNDPWGRGTYTEPLFVLLFIGRPGQAYFLDTELFLINHPPHDFDKTTSRYPHHWSGVQILYPGDSLKVRVYMNPQGCSPPDYSAYPEVTLYDVNLLLEVDESVPVQQRTWGTIKKLYEIRP